jgi:hypothetical protein
MPSAALNQQAIDSKIGLIIPAQAPGVFIVKGQILLIFRCGDLPMRAGLTGYDIIGASSRINMTNTYIRYHGFR